jgi:hypothetical protein
MKKIILLSILLLFVQSNLFAKYVQTCKVKYETQQGWSDYYTVDVTFLSGTELNNATNSYNYSSYSTYAVVFWGEGKASIIEIESYTGCGSEVTQSCISNAYSNYEGEDQRGIKWEVCTKNYCY